MQSYIEEQSLIMEYISVHSRAFLLLKRDFVNLQRFPVIGISALPNHSLDLFHWTAKIEGISGTIWEGGVFQVKLTFTEDFDYKPPQINFMTIPFHPNVDPSDGRVHLQLLSDNKWTNAKRCGDEITVSTLLLVLQAVLSNPELDNDYILNPSAAQLLREAPHTYKQMVLDCVTASLRIDAGMTPFEIDSLPQSPNLTLTETPVSRQKKPVKPISYDKYHILWKGIATSITEYKQKNDFARLLEEDTKLGAVHYPAEPLEAKIEQHTKFKYGRPPSIKKAHQRSTATSAKSRLKRIEELKFVQDIF